MAAGGRRCGGIITTRPGPLTADNNAPDVGTPHIRPPLERKAKESGQMRKIIAVAFVSLGGLMEASGRG